ncbi:MAG TPA: type II toxin-antitoxin system MqsA family antitoxin [Anaerolineales bacterium]|nr:type II toxin-antitoxin system MqsA family antitoxin [Anaerolineales bacterium]
MICLVCRQADLVEDVTSVSFQRGETHLVINDVPARVCPSCGEAFVDEETAVQLLRNAEEMFQAGMRAEVIEYRKQDTI